MPAIPMIELWRGGMLESVHAGHAVVCDETGAVIEAWGDPAAVIFPRSSCKMIQALPLLESGAADRFGLSEAELALALCQSQRGAYPHRRGQALAFRSRPRRGGPALRAADAGRPGGTQGADLFGGRALPDPQQLLGQARRVPDVGQAPRRGAEYVAPDHPVQRAVRAAFEEVTGETSPGFGIDGCSAPNFATSVTGLARAMAGFAAADPDGPLRERAAARLWRAMAAHPELVAGEGRACTALMRAMGGKVAVKTGAEAVFVAILPETRRGIALKILDGGTRAAEAAVVALLVRLGVLAAGHPVVGRLLTDPMRNRRGIAVGEMRLAPEFVG